MCVAHALLCWQNVLKACSIIYCNNYGNDFRKKA